MITCLIAGLKSSANKAVNYDKFKEIIQGLNENPAAFLSHLQDTLQRFTNLNPNSLEGSLLLHIHFFSQSAPDIRRKLQKFFFLIFIVIQLQLSAFSPHPSTPPEPNPPPSPTSALPLDFVHVSFIVVPIIPSPHCPLPTPLWLLLDCS